jgi:hypothetical protein
MKQFSPEFIGKVENQNIMYQQTLKKQRGSYFEKQNLSGKLRIKI